MNQLSFRTSRRIKSSEKDSKLFHIGMLCSVLSLLVPMQIANATNYTTIADGDWNSAATWSGGVVPGSNLGGHIVNIDHDVNYPNTLGDLYIESGTLNISGILTIVDLNISMQDNSGQVNINKGLVIITNNSFLNTQGIVTFTYGAVQLCNGNYTVDNSSQTTGNGYIFNKAGNIERLSSGTFSSNIDWCIDSGSGISLPTVENCTNSRPPLGDCLDKAYYLTQIPYDYGDAPASYGDASHIIPTTPSVYLGAAAPDQETSAQTSNDADGDDLSGSDDEDAFTSLPDLDITDSSYALNVPCVGEAKTVTGWIDFDYSGTFTNSSPNEQATQKCSSGSATLNWDSSNGNFPASLTAGATTARLRASSAGVCNGKGLFGTTNVTMSGGTTLLDSYTGSYDPLNPGSDAEVGSNGNFTISGGGTLAGNASTAGTITNSSSTITGTINEGVSISNLTTPAACSPFSGNAGISASGGLNHDTTKGDLTVSGGNTLTLAPGSYCFNKFTLSGGSILQVSGLTTIYTKDAALSGGSILNTSNNPNNLQLISTGSGGNFSLSGGSGTYMSIYAPDTKLTISGGTDFFGCAVGGDVTLSGGTQFHQDLSLINGMDSTSVEDDGEVEDYSLTIAGSCTGLSGDTSEIAAGIPIQVASGNKVFVASNSPSPNIAGHLKAYSVQTNGSIGTTAAWDAATLMNTDKREDNLFSTDAMGSKIKFDDLDDPAFVAGASPTVGKIKEYTLTPSVDGGIYLAGRASGSWLGPMSRGNDVALLTQMNNMGQFLTDSAYRSFYNGTVSSRSEKILVSSDDGFLYAFDQSTGQLSWGWMPRSLAEELKNYPSFQSQKFMRGTLDIIDAKDSLGNYATYVVGSYKDGLGQYALKLNSSGGLDSVVWDQDYSGSNTEAPNHGEKDYFRDANGLTYVTYLVSNNSSQSTLVIREITTAATNTGVSLNYYATSVPYVIQDFGNSSGPAAKTIYLGDDSGNIKRSALLTAGTLDSAANIKLALEGSTVGSLNAAEPILFLGASSSMTSGLYYLRAQSESRLTLLDYNSSTTNWDKRWTSYVGGAGSWDISGTYTADTSGPPTDDDNDGFFTNVTNNGIQSLPTDARITDAAQIVSNSVILPVSVQAAGNCFGLAYFYLYDLNTGVFPDNKFLNLDSTKITGDIKLGYGDPTRVNISDMPSNELLLGHGMTDQNISNQVELDTSFLIIDKVSTGIRGWKERRQE